VAERILSYFFGIWVVYYGIWKRLLGTKMDFWSWKNIKIFIVEE